SRPPSSPTIVGSAVATIVESSAASSIASRSPLKMMRTCRRGSGAPGTTIEFDDMPVTLADQPVRRNGLPVDPPCCTGYVPDRRASWKDCMTRVPLSVLDLAHIGAGFSSTQTLANSVDLARRVERLGYVRHWFAEHHSMPSIASSAPEILIAHVAARTSTLRVGSGGIMLPNHAPLWLAAALHTLEPLHPDRIDLGIGRAPGSDRAAMAARRPFDAEQFPAQLQELLMLSRGDAPADHPFHGVRAVPSDVPLPPIWILGSSGASARFAGSLG